MERDLKVLLDNKVSMNEKWAAVAKKTNRMLCCINKDITNRDKEVIMTLYIVLVRPHLEYCRFWGPLYEKDAYSLEIVQRAMRMIR